MSVRQTVTLFSAQTATGNGAAQTVNVGGTYQFAIAGTFGGGTGKAQILGPDGATWIDIPNATGAAAAMVNDINLPIGSQVRGVLSGGAGPYSINITLSLYRRQR